MFVDGRTDLYLGDVLNDYFDVAVASSRWRGVFARYDIQAVLVDKGAPIVAVLEATGDWERAFAGPVEVVYVRRP